MLEINASFHDCLGHFKLAEVHVGMRAPIQVLLVPRSPFAAPVFELADVRQVRYSLVSTVSV
jgi:hypothetical protein